MQVVPPESSASGSRESDRAPAVVTGAAGVIGPPLVDALLRRGRRVIAVDDFSSGSRQNALPWADDSAVTLLEWDVTEPLPVAGPIGEIYHLACPASPVHYQRDPVKTIRTSVQGAINVLELGRANGSTVLLASTSEVYGDPLEHPQTESYWGNVNPIGIRACYDEGKRCAEALFTSYRRQYGVDVRIARIFNTYGPGMRPDDGRVMSALIVQALAGRPLTVFGDGTQTRSFCFVTDLVAGLQALMESEDVGDRPVNLGNPVETTVLELAELIRARVGRSSEIEFHDLPSDDPRRRRPDIGRAQSVLEWTPTTSLEDGVRIVIDHFRRLS